MTTAADLLLETARRGELHHAVILHGPHAQALRDLALRAAKALNCRNGTAGDDCSACTRIDRGLHPDVHMISVEADRKLISIEQIRTAVGEATLRPYEGRTKVFILEPADAVSPGGLNALLKTLEEPASDTVFLLLTRSPDLLLPTIRSRSQSIYAADPARGAASARSLQEARLQEIAGFASSADRDELTGAIIDSLHRFATRGESAALLSLASRLAQSDSDREALALLALVLSDAAALHPSDTIDPSKFAGIREAVEPQALLAAADRAINATKWLTVNADVRLLLEHALVPLTKKDPAF
jgi:DNA polymerase III delta prime subunit